MEQGWLYLVVGPSGAGKDTLLNAARAYFNYSPNVIFPYRYITRPAGAGGEDHIAITAENFMRKEQAGLFAFSWGAHQLKYGIPLSINDELTSGKSVVVNVSRSILNEARLEYNNLRILSITVNQEILRQRLRARGRESSLDIEMRLERASAFRVNGPEVIEIDNSHSKEKAVTHFINAIENPFFVPQHRVAL